MLLSKFLLQFLDDELKSGYRVEQRSRYGVATIIMAVLLALLGTATEIIFRLELFEEKDLGVLSLPTSIANWVAVAIMIVLAILVRKTSMAHWAVCPLLTMLLFYYLIMVDYEGSIRQIYLSSVLGITAAFFVLVFFSEVWLISSLVFAPLIGFYLWKTSHSLGGVNWVEFPIQTVFAVFAYTTTAYKVELLQKQSYLGKESYEKSFNRWLKIFETFPEGIAMIRNTEAIMYANSALKKLLDGDDSPSEPERLNDQYSDVGVRFNLKEHAKIKEALEQTRIQKISKDKKPNAKYKEQSIWDFLERNENGATFEIKRRAAKGDRLEGLDSSEQNQTVSPLTGCPELKSLSSSIPGQRRFFSLNQVKVTIAGRVEKIFIVRDETHTIFLEQLMEQKEMISEFTQSMMEQIDEYSKFTQQTLKRLENYAVPAGRPMVDDCSNEMRKARYRIRDFRDIYDISENDFLEPTFRRVDVRASLNEVENAAANDLLANEIEVSQHVHDNTPDYVAIDQDLFVQVMINLLLQSVQAIGTHGFIKIVCSCRVINGVNQLAIDLESSKFQLDRQMAINIRNLTAEKELQKVLSAKVDLNFKIAKILANSLGWKIEFNSFTASRYSLYIPLVHPLSYPEDIPEGEGEVEETKDDQGVVKNVVPGSTNLRCFSKQTERERGGKNELMEEISDKSRPYSAAFAEISGLRPQPFRPINEQPEFDNQQHSPDGNSTKSFRFDSAQGTRQHCASCLLMNSTMIIYFQEKLLLKCDETHLESDAIKRVHKALNERSKHCGCPPYRYFIIDQEDCKLRVNLKYMIPQIKELYKKDDIAVKRVPELKIVVLISENDELTKEACNEAGIFYFVKPKLGNEDALRQLLNPEPSPVPAKTVNTQAHETTEDNQ